MDDNQPLIPPHGGYHKLKSFQVAQLVFDVTVRFCDDYIDRRSRTHDQMVQAARSGKQNIAEGSEASGTSRKSEMKLTGVSRASLEELRLDYEDYLRQHRRPQWGRNDPRRAGLIARRPKSLEDVVKWVQDVRNGQSGRSGPSEQSGRPGPHANAAAQGDCRPAPHAMPASHGAPAAPARHGKPASPAMPASHGAPAPPVHHGKPASRAVPARHGKPAQPGSPGNAPPSTPSTRSTASTSSTPPSSAEIAANGALALINVTCFLLDHQLKAQSDAFMQDGGFTERLYRKRSQKRRQQE